MNFITDFWDLSRILKYLSRIYHEKTDLSRFLILEKFRWNDFPVGLSRRLMVSAKAANYSLLTAKQLRPKWRSTSTGSFFAYFLEFYLFFVSFYLLF